MFNKSNRLDLKSDIYRDRMKSPLTPRKEDKKKTHIPCSYQSICCPNCRYLFRAPLEVIRSDGNSNLRGKADAQMQTEMLRQSPLKTSRNREQISRQHAKLNLDLEQISNQSHGVLTKPLPSPLETLGRRTPKYSHSPLSIIPPRLKLNIPNNQSYSQNGSPICSQTSPVDQQKQLQSHRNSLNYNHNSRSLNQHSLNYNQNSQSYNQNSQRYNQNLLKSPQNCKVSPKISLTPRKNDYLQPKSRPKTSLQPPSSSPHRQINYRSAIQLISHLYNREQITNMLSTNLDNLNSPSQTQIPAYNKMLLLQLKQKQQNQRK